MCIGIPMQVVSVEPGRARCVGRDEQRLVRTALVGDVQAGDWLLVFLDDARERIDAARAAEVNAALDLVLGALDGAARDATVAFALPSQLSADTLKAMTGQ